MSDSITTLAVAQLQPNPFQPRDKIKKEDLVELAESIKNYGILEPLLIAQTPAGFQIIAGERRWRAARQAGLTEVPVIIKKTNTRGMLEMALVENIQRADLTAIERAQALQQLIRDFGYTVTSIAAKIGKSIPFISNSIRLLELPDALKDGLMSGAITEGHARALSTIRDEKSMIECYKIVLKENANVRRAEDLARRFREQIIKQSYTPYKVRQIPSETLKQWMMKMKEHYRIAPTLGLTRSARQTKLNITLKGTPAQTQSDLEKILTSITKIKEPEISAQI